MGKVAGERSDIDRGWAYVVMVATYFGMVIYCNTLYMSGVIFMALLEKYGEGETKTSLVGAVSTGLLCFAAPVAGVINNKYSCRVSIVLGGVFTTVGFASSAFVPSLNWMILTSGVFVGLGYGISSCGLICAVGFYFEKRRDIVISSAFLTVGVAMFLAAPFGLYLISEHGLTAAFLILGCIQAQMCVLGMLCRPSSLELELLAKKAMERKIKQSRTKSYLDVSLIKNRSYMCFLLSTAVWNFALCVAIMHLPNYVSVLGGSYHDIGLLMTSFSVANLIGRLCGALTVSKLHANSIYAHVGALGLSGILSSLFIFYSKLTGGTYIFTIQMGIFTGWPNAMMTPLSLSFVGVEKLSEAYGLAFFFCGLGVSTGPVFIGYIYAVTGSYEYSFVVAGAVLILGCLCGCGSLCRKRNTEKKAELLVVENTGLTYCDKIEVGSSTMNGTVEHEQNDCLKLDDVDKALI